MFHCKTFKAAFAETLFALLRNKDLTIIGYLYDLLTHIPLRAERLCSWIDFKDAALAYVCSRRIPAWIDAASFVPPSENVLAPMRLRANASIRFFRAHYNTIDCIQTLLHYHIDQFSVDPQYKVACNAFEAADYKYRCDQPLTPNETVLVERGYMGLDRAQ